MNKHTKTQAGNALIFVLLGIALFTSLAFMISRGMRSENTSNMSNRQADLAATDLLTYGQQIERAINRMRRRNISENDISFDTPKLTGYDHTPAQPDENKVFMPSGGAMSFRLPTDVGTIGFIGDLIVTGMGNDANAELLMIGENIDAKLCEFINKKVGLTGIPTTTNLGTTTGPFTGSYTTRGGKNTLGNTTIALANQQAGCFENVAGSGNYIFYFVLLER